MQAKTINKILGVIIGILLICVVYKEIEHTYWRSHMYNWRYGVLSEKDNPIQLTTCYHYGFDTDEILQDGWSDISYSNSWGAQESLFPDRFTFVWFAYKENKFYMADIPLPVDSMTKLAQELEKKYKQEGLSKKDIYLVFYAQVKHGGAVSMWMSDKNNPPSKITDHNAQETTIDWNSFKSGIRRAEKYGREEWIDIVLKRYNWNIIVDLNTPNTDRQSINDIRIYTYGGLSYYPLAEEYISSNAKSVPHNIIIKWKNGVKKSFTASLYFDDTEILNCFSELYQNADSLLPSDIIVTIDDDSEPTQPNEGKEITIVQNRSLRASIVVKRGDKEIEISNILGSDDIVEHR